jgi:DNA polymerase III subunit chi
MGAAFFYHLTRAPLEAALPGLIEKALGQGWRVAVRGRTDAVLDHLDRALWLGDGFLPHGRAGGPHDGRQPVLLTSDRALPNSATCLMSIEGADVTVEEVSMLARTCILFDGNDDAAVEAARAQWRTLTAAEVEAEYWNQADGRWTRQAKSPPRAN